MDTEVKLPQRPTPHVQYLTSEEVGRLGNAINHNLHCPLDAPVGGGSADHRPPGLGGAISGSSALESNETEIQIVGKGGEPQTRFFPTARSSWMEGLFSTIVPTISRHPSEKNSHTDVWLKRSAGGRLKRACAVQGALASGVSRRNGSGWPALH
jgi:hypothetical protein